MDWNHTGPDGLEPQLDRQLEPHTDRHIGTKIGTTHQWIGTTHQWIRTTHQWIRTTHQWIRTTQGGQMDWNHMWTDGLEPHRAGQFGTTCRQTDWNHMGQPDGLELHWARWIRTTSRQTDWNIGMTDRNYSFIMDTTGRVQLVASAPYTCIRLSVWAKGPRKSKLNKCS